MLLNLDPLHTIYTRRSIRKYTTQPIHENVLRELIEAAVQAPSAGNQQPWQFLIIDEKNLLEQIPQYHPNATMITQAQKGILICADSTKEKHKGYFPMDCSAATQNLLLAAHAKGLGGCWLGIYPREERIQGMRQIFHIPDHIIPFALVSLGYPAEEKPQPDRYEENRIHYNKW